MNINRKIVMPQPQRRRAQIAFQMIRWVLLCIIGTVMSIFLSLVLPNGGILAYATYSIVSSIKSWLHDLYPNLVDIQFTPFKMPFGSYAGTRMEFEAVLALVITGLYLGLVLALISSKNKRQIYVAIGLTIVYLLGLCWTFLRIRAVLA